MDRVIIGAGPHKQSVTIEARDTREILRATGRFGTDARSYRQLLAYARQWPERVWAVEGANGIGRPLAQRLWASGERVLDVPAANLNQRPGRPGGGAAIRPEPPTANDLQPHPAVPGIRRIQPGQRRP